MDSRGTAGTSGYATVDGLCIYYELHGEPLHAGVAPVVLLHGGSMSIDTAFAGGLLPMLARGRAVVAIEQQCHGHTGDREGPASMVRMVEDTAGVLTHLEIDSADVVGHSLGGIIALGVAIRHPRIIRSVSALSAFSNLDGMLPELAQMQREPSHQPSPELIPLLPTEADFAAWQASFQRNADDPDAFFPFLAKVTTMLSTWEGWTDDEIRAIRSPALIVIGDNDFVRVEHAAEMARLIPDAQLAVLPGTTHMSILKRGAWIAPMIEARLAGLGQA